MGKGLSKDKKARKLALQHWLEAVSSIPLEVKYIVPPHKTTNLSLCIPNLIPYCYRSIHDIDMAIIFTSIMPNGSTVRVNSPSFIGKIIWYIIRNY